MTIQYTDTLFHESFMTFFKFCQYRFAWTETKGKVFWKYKKCTISNSNYKIIEQEINKIAMLFSDLVTSCSLYRKRTSYQIVNDDVIVILYSQFGPSK